MAGLLTRYEYEHRACRTTVTSDGSPLLTELSETLPAPWRHTLHPGAKRKIDER
jgi:hypothetical protein